MVGTSEDLTTYVDAPQQRKGRPGDLPFRSMPAHAQTRYALSLEKESIKGVEATFGPRAMAQWSKALDEWNVFGDHVYDAPNQVRDDRGDLVTQQVRLDQNIKTNPEAYDKFITTIATVTTPEAKKRFLENQQYWADRWADQMNYPYWKDRCMAEMEPDGTKARRLFYEGTKAYKSVNFPVAVEKFREGLNVWKELLDRHKSYREDELNRKDTGLIVKRYARACQMSQVEFPKGRAVPGPPQSLRGGQQPRPVRRAGDA